MRLSYRFLRFLCWWLYITVFRGRVFGQRHIPPRGGVLVLANHQSYMDPVLVALAFGRETSYMGREALFRNPSLRTLIRYLNCFPVKEEAADIGSIKEALRRLRSGRMVVIFPEGSRTWDGTIADFLPGAAAIALRAGCPILPVLITGAFEAWPRNRRLPRPSPIAVHYDRPILPQEFAGLEPHDLARLFTDGMRTFQRNVRQRYRICGPAPKPAPANGTRAGGRSELEKPTETPRCR